MLNGITIIVGSVLAMALLVSQASPTLQIPGNYSVVVSGLDYDGAHYVRLAEYSFRADGTMYEDFWAWVADKTYVYGTYPFRIGSRSGEDKSVIKDQDKYVMGPLTHLKNDVAGIDNPQPLFGHWSQAGNIVTIAWDGGLTERWRVKSVDADLNELDLLFTSSRPQSVYYTYSGNPEPNAQIAGWGFGAPGWGFGEAETNPKEFMAPHAGMFLQYGGATKTNYGVRSTSINFSEPGFYLSDTGVFKRFKTPDSTEVDQHNFYAYLALWGNKTWSGKGNSKKLARRLAYQASHDYGPNSGYGHIQTEGVGHSGTGLQIIDAKKHYRGFVMAENTREFSENTLSAYYWLKNPN